LAAPAPPLVAPTDFRRIRSTTSPLTIKAKSGYRHRLIDVFVGTPVDGEYVEINIAGRGKIRLYQTFQDSKLVQALPYGYLQYGALRFLKYLIPDLPDLNAAQDEDLVIVATGAFGAIDAYYTEMKEADVSSYSLPGGSAAVLNPHIYWLSHDVAWGVDGTFDFNSALMPIGVRSLVSKGQVKASEEFTLYAIVLGNEAASTDSHVDAIKIWDEQTMLFTPDDGSGLQVDPALGNELKVDIGVPTIWKLRDPYVLGRDHKYTIQALFDFITTSRAAGRYKLGLVGVHRILV